MKKNLKAKDAAQSQYDKELVVIMQTGTASEKEKAYQALYKKHKHGIMHYISRFMNTSDEEVEDLTQDVFIKVYEKIDSYQAETSGVSTWLYKMTTNYLIDVKRKGKFEVISIESMSENKSGDSEKDDYREFKYQFVDKHTDTFKELELAERSLAVHLAASRIKSELGRTIIQMKYFEQLTNDEIAVKLGMNINTVKIYDLRAKKEMLAMFTKQGVDFEYGTISKKKVLLTTDGLDEESAGYAMFSEIEIVPLWKMR